MHARLLLHWEKNRSHDYQQLTSRFGTSFNMMYWMCGCILACGYFVSVFYTLHVRVFRFNISHNNTLQETSKSAGPHVLKNGLALSTITNWATERVFGLERAIHYTDGAQLKGVCVCAYSYKCSFTVLYLLYGTVLRPIQMCPGSTCKQRNSTQQRSCDERFKGLNCDH